MHELVSAAFRGDDRARQDLYFWAYLWPRLARRLWGAGGHLTPPEDVSPGSGGDQFDLICTLAVTALGPQPEPPDSPSWGRSAREATALLRDALLDLARELDDEVKASVGEESDTGHRKEQRGKDPIPSEEGIVS